MQYIQYHTTDRIAYITLNRPEKRNAFSPELVSELKAAFDRAEKDEQAKVVIMRAYGPAFCAGADLEYLQKLQGFSYSENVADSDRLKELFLKIYTLNKVVIAQIQGHALAGGCGLATVCDFAFAVPEANFGYTEVRIGFVPAIVSVFLLKKINEGKAKQLLLSGALITAKEAQEVGLINFLSTNKESLEKDVHAFACTLIETNSQYAMAVTKQLIASVQSVSIEEALTYASHTNARVRESEDFKKGIDSFLNKKKIGW